VLREAWVTVALTKAEVFQASMVGVCRHVASMFKKRNLLKYPQFTEGWVKEIEGACSEAAVAKHFDLWWRMSVNEFFGGDIGGKLQVRWVPEQERQSLILRPKDRNDDLFVLVTGAAPNMEPLGWILGADGRKIGKPFTHGGGPPAIGILAPDLRPFSTLTRGMVTVKSTNS